MVCSFPVYTIQPVVKPIVKPVDIRLNVCIHSTTGCQTSLITGIDNRLYRVNVASISHELNMFSSCDRPCNCRTDYTN